MPDYDDENYPLISSKKFSSIRFRRSGISSKRKSELKAAISGPYTFDGGGISTTALGDAPLRTLNGTRSPHSNSASTILSGPSPHPQTFTRSVRRNSDLPLKRHHSSLAWPSNRPAITPIDGSPHHPTRATSRRLNPGQLMGLVGLERWQSVFPRETLRSSPHRSCRFPRNRPEILIYLMYPLTSSILGP
jgi:hypothetical protein